MVLNAQVQVDQQFRINTAKPKSAAVLEIRDDVAVCRAVTDHRYREIETEEQMTPAIQAIAL